MVKLRQVSSLTRSRVSVGEGFLIRGGSVHAYVVSVTMLQCHKARQEVANLEGQISLVYHSKSRLLHFPDLRDK